MNTIKKAWVASLASVISMTLGGCEADGPTALDERLAPDLWVGGPLSAIVIDFESLETPGTGYTFHQTYSEDGFTISNPGDDAYYAFVSHHTDSPDFPGSTALGRNTALGSTLLTKDDGGTFDAVSIDLSEQFSAYVAPRTVSFWGTKADGSTVTVGFTTDGVFGLETFLFSGFTDLVSLSSDYPWPYHQFDNVVLSVVPTNSPPVANAGSDQTLTVGETVQLDGSGSSDPDEDPLAFDWLIITKPAGSLAYLSDASAVNPDFVGDVAGAYVVRLVVNDGLTDSDADDVTITVQTPAEATQRLIDEVTAIVAAGGMSRGEGTSLVAKLNAALRRLSDNPRAAVNQFGAFINQVNAFVRSGRLSDGQGQSLIDAVQAIIDAVAG